MQAPQQIFALKYQVIQWDLKTRKIQPMQFFREKTSYSRFGPLVYIVLVILNVRG